MVTWVHILLAILGLSLHIAFKINICVNEKGTAFNMGYFIMDNYINIICSVIILISFFLCFNEIMMLLQIYKADLMPKIFCFFIGYNTNSMFRGLVRFVKIQKKNGN